MRSLFLIKRLIKTKKVIKVTKSFFHLFIFVFTQLSCNGPIEPVESSVSFGIYFLEDNTLKIQDIFNKELAELKLASTPWLSVKDIEFYDWSSHCIYLKNTKEHLKKYLQYNDGWNEPYLWYKPYVVVANQKRCYIGYFNVFGSTRWLLPMIDVSLHLLGYPKDVLSSFWDYLYIEDIRNNKDVKEILIQNNLFRGGINVVFDTSNFHLKYNNSRDTTLIEYSIKITNLDQDNLYVLDPDLMKKELFHYYNNGPAFKNINNNKVYYSIDNSETPKPYYYSWDPKWFTKLIPGQTIYRTIKQSYTYFSPGRFTFQMSYNSPVFNLEKNVREIGDGRYWLGTTCSNTLDMVIEEYQIMNSHTPSLTKLNGISQSKIFPFIIINEKIYHEE